MLLYNLRFSQGARTRLALDEKIYDLRKDKLKQIEALGQPAYPHKYEPTHAILARIRHEFKGTEP